MIEEDTPRMNPFTFFRIISSVKPPMSPTDGMILFYLHSVKSAKYDDLFAVMPHLEEVHIRKRISELAKMGYIERVRTEWKTDIFLTEQGCEFVDNLYKIFYK